MDILAGYELQFFKTRKGVKRALLAAGRPS
jgi:hypothetical protein